MNLAKIEFPDKLDFIFLKYRYKVSHGGRGSAKSWSYAKALLIMGRKKKLRILCAREVQKSIKESVHKLLSDQIEAMGLGSFYEVLDNTIRGRNGTEFVFAGLGVLTTESIKSYEGMDIVWVEEGQTVKKKSWEILIPTIRKPGSEIWVTMNPELDTDDTYVRFVVSTPPDSKVVQINYMDNRWFPDVLEMERQHCFKTNRDDYDNIWEGKCRKSAAGAIFAGEIETAILGGQIRPVPYDPMLKVHTIWDLGWNDSMTISMVQKGPAEIRIIDYIEDSHKTLAWYVKELEKRPYNWGQDWLPHDGFHKDFKTGQSTEEILIALKRDVAPGDTVDPAIPNIGLEDGIKAARLNFSKFYIDEVKCARLLECLRRYKRRLHQTTQEPMGPLHDEYCHGADNFRYINLVAPLLTNDLTPPPPSSGPRASADWR